MNENKNKTIKEEEKREQERIAEDIRRPIGPRRPSPYERTKAAVYATGNRWAIENFHATHD